MTGKRESRCDCLETIEGVLLGGGREERDFYLPFTLDLHPRRGLEVCSDAPVPRVLVVCQLPMFSCQACERSVGLSILFRLKMRIFRTPRIGYVQVWRVVVATSRRADGS